MEQSSEVSPGEGGHTMATSRRESQPNASRTNRNMSPVLKPSESDRGLLRRVRSVLSSPDRRSSASTAASSSTNACTASSRSSTSGSASSSSSRSSMVGAKQATGAMRRRADKSGGATSVWPHALTTPGKDPASRAAKSASTANAHKSKLSARHPAAAASSPKPRTQKARNPSAAAKRRTGLETSSVQRTTSVPVTAAVAPKADEPDVELLVEAFDEMDCISTPSIEEHLQERLPDPASPSEPSSNREEHKDVQETITEQVISEEQYEGNADAGLDSGMVVAMETVGETELNDSVGEIALKGAVDEPKWNEPDSETELKDPELAVKEEAAKTPEAVHQRWRKGDGKSGGVAEEGRSKTTTMQERRNKVMTLVGRFETAMSGRE